VDILSYYGAKNDLAKKTLDILKMKQELVEMRIGLEIASGRYLTETAGPPRFSRSPLMTQRIARAPKNS
jgi:hypothetical protein